jgi:hypothetical protein
MYTKFILILKPSRSQFGNVQMVVWPHSRNQALSLEHISAAPNAPVLRKFTSLLFLDISLALFSSDRTEDDIHLFETLAFGLWDQPETCENEYLSGPG